MGEQGELSSREGLPGKVTFEQTHTPGEQGASGASGGRTLQTEGERGGVHGGSVSATGRKAVTHAVRNPSEAQRGGLLTSLTLRKCGNGAR